MLDNPCESYEAVLPYVQASWPFCSTNMNPILHLRFTSIRTFRGPHILDEELFRSIRHFVLDEADMLLEGSYVADVEKILNALKVTRRVMIKNKEVKVHESVVQHILSAATLPTYGERSMEKYINKRYMLYVMHNSVRQCTHLAGGSCQPERAIYSSGQETYQPDLKGLKHSRYLVTCFENLDFDEIFDIVPMLVLCVLIFTINSNFYPHARPPNPLFCMPPPSIRTPQ